MSRGVGRERAASEVSEVLDAPEDHATTQREPDGSLDDSRLSTSSGAPALLKNIIQSVEKRTVLGLGSVMLANGP
jgi:hypothetical protein